MGILTRGQYTHGTLTWNQILLLSSSRQLNTGDTVFDTTYNKKRMWDGFNFVHTHQASVVASGSGTNYGSVVTVSANTDDAIRFTVSLTDAEGVIGVAEDQKGSANADVLPIHYHGYTRLLAEAAPATPLAPADLMDLGTLQKYSNTVTAGVGVYAISINTSVTANSTAGDTGSLRDVIFRPIERN